MLTAERLRELFRYDPETGEFYRKVKVNNRCPAGQRVGTINGSGYVILTVDYKIYLAHRLAWLYVHGELPSEDIDHINLDKADNRISNLRLATDSQNNANKRRTKANTSGFKGVSWQPHARAFKAQIRANGRSTHLGYRKTAEEAHQLYTEAASKHFGEYARSN